MKRGATTTLTPTLTWKCFKFQIAFEMLVSRRRSIQVQPTQHASAVLAPRLYSGLRKRTQPDRPIGRGQQQQEKHSVSFVFGSGSAATRTRNAAIPFGCAPTPPPCSTALFQDHFENWKLIRCRDSATCEAHTRAPRDEENH